ncbi:hypothetical protein [Alicyclobacillus ferrooxydans]|uniref:SLH domain-containing protein n=1 Tax=Alicyclobacillus ferrooxydans TaxID=471514 RepID=A0A0P9GWD4_9BACL|nr:hypothetical protein [Alicyclobacillus ferrooxydans]KPV45599.1 hypothetical protein AN477_01350 [Alicyclobacillus ferrooxydans]
MKIKWTSIASTLVAIAGIGVAGAAGAKVIYHAQHPVTSNSNALSHASTNSNALATALTNQSSNGDNTAESGSANTPANTAAENTSGSSNLASTSANPNSSNQGPLSGSTQNGVANPTNQPGSGSAQSQSGAGGGAGQSSTGGASGGASGGANGGANASGSSSTGNSGGSTILGSGNGPFDDSVKPGYLSNLQVLADFGKDIGIKPDPSGTSTFKDLPTSNPDWGIIHAMIEQGLIRDGISSTYFGANINYRIRDLSSLYLAYAHIHIYPSIYDPGYDQPLVWDRTVGLLNGVTGGYPTTAYQNLGPGDGLCVRQQDMTSFLANVNAFSRGYRPAAQGYDQLVYPIRDEANTFPAGQPPDGYQASITKTYHIMNDLLVKQSGNNLILSIPAFAIDNEWKMIVGNKVQFSLDGGQTWQTAKNPSSNLFSFYESADASYGGLPAGKLPSRILVKSPIGDDLWVRLFDGKDLVSDETIGWINGAPTETRNDVSYQTGP